MTNRVKEQILLSWKQCYEQKIDKEINRITKRVNTGELEKKKRKNKTLIELFNREVDNLLEKYSVKNSVFLLTDRDMVLISKRENLADDYSVKVRGGDCFSEKSCGTNAISLAEEIGEEVYLTGDDHYCYLFQDLGCIAAPIEVDQKIIGFLDFSVFKRKIREKDKMLFNLLYKSIKLKINNLFIRDEKIDLNEKEKNILKLTAKGYTIEETSEKLELAYSTVTYYRKMICDKLGAENITHAVAKGLKNGL